MSTLTGGIFGSNAQQQQQNTQQSSLMQQQNNAAQQNVFWGGQSTWSTSSTWPVYNQIATRTDRMHQMNFKHKNLMLSDDLKEAITQYGARLYYLQNRFTVPLWGSFTSMFEALLYD